MSSLKRKSKRPIGIDLFSGAGGMSLGFEQAGFDIAAAVEIDPIHCGVHKYNFPDCTTICASVTDIGGEQIRKLAAIGDAEIDVVFGGAPCQGFSMIGKRAIDDPRNRLVFHFVRLIRELKPKYCVFENVKGLTLGQHARFLDELIAALEDAGYKVVQPYRVLNAADYGVPQDRKRLFLLGVRKDQAIPEYPMPGKRTSVRDAISDLPEAEDFAELKDSDSVKIKWTTKSRYARVLRGMESDPSDFGYARALDKNLLTSSTRTEHTSLSKRRFARTEHGKTEPVSRFRKLDLDGLCNTLRAGTDSARGAFTSPRPIHPSSPRVITVREAARLHSYPDWFRLHTTKWHGFRQIGNSVPPLLARAVAAELAKAMGYKPAKPAKTISCDDEALLSMDMSEAASYFRVPRNTIAQRIRKSDTAQIALL